MGGGLIQLVAVGEQDTHLTGNPQITYFKFVYRRHTNFSMESISQSFSGSADFGNSMIAQIERKGDLIYKMFLQIKLPAPSSVITSTGGTPCENWVNNIGNALIEYIEIEVGGQLLDKQYGLWFDIWNELTDPLHNEWTLVGKKASNNEFNKVNTNSSRYYIPLKFWFCRNTALAFPLLAIPYYEMKLKMKLRSLVQCVVSDGTDISASGSITEFSLWIDYVYLDSEERRKFTQESQEYLIEQLQYIKNSVDAGSNNIEMELNHPVKELIWTIQQNDAIAGASTGSDSDFNLNLTAGDVTGKNDWFNYGSILNTNLGLGTYDPFNTATILFSGQDRFAKRDAVYFRTVQPLNHHSHVPEKHIYVYSFALKPEENQPSGTCNFSRISSSVLSIDGVMESSTINIFAVNYNVLLVKNGMCALAYSN